MDRFEYLDESGQPTGREAQEQVEEEHKGFDFQSSVLEQLSEYGRDMWIYREHADRGTTRALNLYRGEHRGFEYLTPRLRITPKDFTSAQRARYLHFICSPTRAQEIMREVHGIADWNPVTIYEPIPVGLVCRFECEMTIHAQDRCVPSELPALREVLPDIHILSPNALEACTLLSLASDREPSRELIEAAATQLYDFGVGPNGQGSVLIRSGELGVLIHDSTGRLWIEAYFQSRDSDKVVDVTGAGNAFLGGLAAGLYHSNQDVRQAAIYASISASFVIEQHGLPTFKDGLWNGDSPERRLHSLRSRAVG
ncbi:hypothetical protein PIIN_01074 [Serendipita indica DSM 11827]|uniref:Carbohydrate kinase PfkB domain-containing protein n=1 Tax=Serendipita indica (strain DSM 11827) TaxID=1109443 RepID=G4T7H0_SERID|nr:hypothetical protein PIIN_01074 [Serendipita indica DSM 11827]